MKILVAEDEPAMQKILKAYLEKVGYEVVVVNNGEEALEALYEETFELVVLDWMMPKMSGIEVCKEMKRLQMSTKILMLTAKTETEDEIMGFHTGVMDYVRKPFDPRVLMLRVQSLIGNKECITCGSLKLYPNKSCVENKEEMISLSATEQKLLMYLMENKEIILTRQQLIDHVWGMDYEGGDRTLDTHVRRLRKKIGEEWIETYRGIGYRMRKTHE